MSIEITKGIIGELVKSLGDVKLDTADGKNNTSRPKENYASIEAADDKSKIRNVVQVVRRIDSRVSRAESNIKTIQRNFAKTKRDMEIRLRRKEADAEFFNTKNKQNIKKAKERPKGLLDDILAKQNLAKGLAAAGATGALLRGLPKSIIRYGPHAAAAYIAYKIGESVVKGTVEKDLQSWADRIEKNRGVEFEKLRKRVEHYLSEGEAKKRFERYRKEEKKVFKNDKSKPASRLGDAQSLSDDAKRRLQERRDRRHARKHGRMGDEQFGPAVPKGFKPPKAKKEYDIDAFMKSHGMGGKVSAEDKRLIEKNRDFEYDLRARVNIRRRLEGKDAHPELQGKAYVGRNMMIPSPNPIRFHRAAIRRDATPQSFANQRQMAEFLKFGQLPRGFEHVAGNRGILGKPMAVAAGGAMPFGGTSGGTSSYTSSGSSRSFNTGRSSGIGPGQTFTSTQRPSDFVSGNKDAVPIEAYKNFGDGSVSVSKKGYVDKQQYYNAAVRRFARSNLNGFVPEDGYKYGIHKGTPEEWAQLAMRTTQVESNFNVNTTNMADPGGSRGLMQWGNHHGINDKNWRDPNAQLDAFVSAADMWVVKGGGYINPPKGVKAKRYHGWGGMSSMFSTFRNDKVNKAGALNQSNKLASGAPKRTGDFDRAGKTITAMEKSAKSNAAAQSLLLQEDAIYQKQGGKPGTAPPKKPLLSQSELQTSKRRMSMVRTMRSPDIENFVGSGFDPKAGKVKFQDSRLSNYGSRRRGKKYEYIGVHYTGGNTLKSALARAKKENIGYQILIDKDGTPHMVQDPDKGRSNHWGVNQVSNRIGNHNSVGISYVGTGKGITKEQMITGLKTIEHYRKKYNIDPKNVLGHGEATQNHRAWDEGDELLTPYRQWKGIANPNIPNRQARQNFAGLRRGKIMNEKLSKDVLSQLTEQDPRLKKMDFLKEIADDPTKVKTDGVQDRLKAQYQMNTMKRAKEKLGHTEEKSETAGSKPSEKDQILGMADAEAKTEIEETQRVEKEAEAKAASGASNGTPGGGQSSGRHVSEGSFPKAGDQGMAQAGQCWV